MPPQPSSCDAAAAATTELSTVGDFLRYATSRFNAASLAYGHGTANALDEAAFLILEALHLPVDRLEPFLQARLLASERERIAGLIEARVRTRRPAAYLLGKAYIGGIAFHVDERVLVPRSYIGELLRSDLFAGETGGLIERADAVERVLDLGTGCGCLAIIAASVFPAAAIDAVDLSAAALEVARRNVDESGLADRISLFEGDLFAPLADRGRYDLIISNPPYVDAASMASLPPEHRHEPEMALFGGADGLDILRRILAEGGAHLREGGGLLCEIGRGRRRLETEFPRLPFRWLDTETSSGEVFWLAADALLDQA
jgi:ribosomal protein L3 glutamine methyltransferase